MNVALLNPKETHVILNVEKIAGVPCGLALVDDCGRIRVEEVNTPLARGLFEVGDYLMAINGKRQLRAKDFARTLIASGPIVSLHILRHLVS